MRPGPSERLHFREMTEADVADIATLETGGSRSAAEWVDWNLRNYDEHGFGLWVVETHDGAFVGDCGLTMQPVDGACLVEAGWHVRADRRRLGYAAEAAGAVLGAAALAGIEHVVALVRPDNVASRGVARAVGMALERETEVRGRPALVFGIDLTRRAPVGLPVLSVGRRITADDVADALDDESLGIPGSGGA